ncbi:MAG: hypothetical protein P8X42_15995, partial [Calditrichaceae bacterium]
FYTPEPLFISARKNNTELYQLNPDLAARYFNSDRVTVPKLFPYTFAKHKDEETIRIICLGGSTTAGFPFDYQIPFPFQLQKIMEARYPEQKVEVINMGISAVNSYTVLDFMPDILSVEPDYIVIYMGHNEFYGAYGSASSISGWSHSGLIRLYLKLKKYHLVHMLETWIQSFTNKDRLKSPDRTLMEQVIRDEDIAYGSGVYNRTLQNFRKNLGLIINFCRKNDTPVLIGKLVCNLKDQPPLRDNSSSKLTYNINPVEKIVKEIKNIPINSRENMIVQIDSLNEMSASSYFKLAKYILDMGDSLTARYCYSKARDLDLIRFRASSDINPIINSFAQNMVKIVNIDSVFRSNARFGIPGDDLFTDHLHPTPHGYYLIAEAFAKSLGIPGSYDKIFNYPGDARHITDLDMDMGLIRIYKLKHRWPFERKVFNFRNYKPYGDLKAAEIAYNYIFKEHNWYKAHYRMANVYISDDKIPKARNEYEAVSYYYTDQADPLFKIGETYARENTWDKAELYYSKALEKSPNNAMIYNVLALAQWKQRKFVKAVNTIQYAIQAYSGNIGRQTEAKFLLANILIDMKRPDDAAIILQDLLKYNPEYKPAKNMLKKITKGISKE